MITVTLDFDPPDVPDAVRTTAVVTAAGDPVSGLAYPIAWTAGAGGAWSFAFAEAAGPTAYRYTAVATYGGVDTAAFDGTATTGDFVGRIAAATDLRARFGPANVAGWSATASNPSGLAQAEDPAAVRASIEHAEDEVESLFAGSVYAVPFVPTGGRMPAVLVDAVVVMAAYRLYTQRGLRDAKVGGDLSALRRDALDALSLYAGGARHFAALRQRDGSAGLAVTVVEPGANRISDGAALAPAGQDPEAGRRLIPGVGWVRTN
ncbi:MAG: hypothetical protein JWO31_1075 [Phycisphaerales bacterium]|nr:hypothetical protein [Phycisphaerales bacterium]